MARATLYFGFGGSGIKTLMSLNALLAEDPVWRYRARDDVYYVIADTETDQIEKFKRDYQRKFGRETGGNLLSIDLAQGLTTLGPRVHRYFVEPFASKTDPKTEAAKNRLYEHWWVMPDGVPFTAPMVRNLKDGAGQCPPASFFLAWSYLHLFERHLEGFVSSIQRARASHENPDPLKDLRVHVVASIAGGTGRGCWVPLAFKLRKILLDKGAQPSPEAYLFDASCFSELFSTSRDQETRLKVNALTGLSELSAWMSGVGTDLRLPAYRYFLPSQQHPGEESQDVLSTRVPGHEELVSPADRIFLIFGNSQVGGLGKSDAYFEMAGKALYTKLTLSQVKGGQVNEHDAYRSVGALTFEINAGRLRRYFENLARIRFAKQLAEPDEDLAEKVANEFIAAMGLDFHVRQKEDIVQDPEGNLLQRACHELLKLREDGIRQARGELNQDYEYGRDAVRDAIAPSPRAAAAAVEEALKTMPTLGNRLKDAVKSAYGEGKGSFRSLAAVSRLLDRARTRLSKLERPPAGYLEPKQLADEIQGQWEEGDVPKDSLVAFIRQREGREGFLGVTGERFSEKELGEIEGRTREELLRWHYALLLQAIQEHATEQAQELIQWQQHCESLLESTGRVERVLLHRMGEALSDVGTEAGMSVGEMFDRLFTDKDHPEQPLLVNAKGPERLYYRELKPVLARGEEVTLLGAEDAIAVHDDAPLNRRVLDYIFGEDLSLAHVDLPTGLEQEIERAVQLGTNFLERHFSFAPVLEGLVQAWVDRLNATKGNQDQHEELKNLFKKNFGKLPTYEIDRYKSRTLEESLRKLLISAASLCRPYADYKERVGDDRRMRGDVDVALLAGLPPLYGASVNSHEFETDVQAYFRQHHYTDISIAVDTGENEKRSPFLLTVYTSEGVPHLTDLSSVDGWKGDHQVYDILKRAEDPQSPVVFEKGVGYVDPVYVRNPEIRALRWRPWLPDLIDHREETLTLDALLHGLFAPAPERAAPFEARGWKFPLISEGALRRYAFERKALHNDGNGRYLADEVGTPWEIGENLGQNVLNLRDFFADPANANYRSRVIREMELFWGELAIRLGFGKETDAYRPLMQEYLERLDQRRRQTEEEDQAAVWGHLCERLKSWRDQGIR